MEKKYLVKSADLTAVADAIREKGGTSDALTFPGGFADAIAAIQAGGGGEGGGNANMYSGTITFEQQTTVTGNGLIMDLGLPSRVKWLFLWLDREYFLSLESVSNNYYYTLTIIPLAASELPPIRTGSATIALDTKDRLFSTQIFASTTSGSPNGYGMANAFGSPVTAYIESWACNDDGTISLYKASSANQIFFAADYHYIAIC